MSYSTITTLHSKVTTLYRVETWDQQGMYSSAYASFHMPACCKHPAPQDDMELVKSCGLSTLNNCNPVAEGMPFEGWRFAFYDLDQLNTWLHCEEVKMRLAQDNMYVFIYKVPIDYVRVGSTQCIFKPAYAHRHNFLNLVEV